MALVEGDMLRVQWQPLSSVHALDARTSMLVGALYTAGVPCHVAAWKSPREGGHCSSSIGS